MLLNVKLDSILYADTPDFIPSFGSITTRSNRSLTTKDLNENLEKLVSLGKTIEVLEDSQTTEVEYNAFFSIQSENATLEIDRAVSLGCIIHIFAKENANVKYTAETGVVRKSLNKNESIKLVWNGEFWINTSEVFLNYVYPVGSLYWTTENINPSTLFGGTWEPIKDKFILSAGSTYKNGNTGGSASVVLTENNIPSHYHTMAHTHTYTPSGTVDKHEHTMSHRHDFSYTSSGAHSHCLTVYTGETRGGFSYTYAVNNTYDVGSYGCVVGSYAEGDLSTGAFVYDINDAHSTTPKYDEGTGGYARYANWGAKRNNSYKRTILQEEFHGHAGTSEEASSTNTDPAQPTFNAKKGETAETSATSGETGSSIGHDNMPPYITEYCWERTA